MLGNQNFFAGAGQPDTNAIDIEFGNVGVADRRENAAEIGVGGEKSSLDERRMADGVADALALVAIPAAFDGDGDELGRAFAVADDGLREFEGNAA